MLVISAGVLPQSKLSFFKFLICFLTGLATCIALSLPVNAATEVGSMPGSFAVSPTGAATYSIPIHLPPGVRGLAPHLALVYDSQSSNGIAGYGWNLSGLSAITVCGSTVAQDDVNQGVSFTGQSPYPNNFCLDGERLMLASGNNGAGDSVYRKEIDDESEAVAYTSGGAGSAPTIGPQYFVVNAPNGLKYEYGKTADSEIVATGPGIAAGVTEVRTWALDAISDSYGNSVNFHYAQDTANGDFWPTSINYTNFNGNGGLYTVTFGYDTLSGIGAGLVHTSYLAGAVISQTRRLNQINVEYNGSTVFTYSLTYKTTLTDLNGKPGTERNHLTGVTECAGSTCYPTTTIDWQDGVSGWSTLGQAGSYTDATHAGAMHLMDINGDGLADIVYPGGSDWMVMLANGNGFDAAQNTTVPVGDYKDALVIDFNGDGKADLIEPTSASNGNWEVVTFQVSGTLAAPAITGTITTALTAGGTTIPATGGDGNATIVDLDGDGADDLVYSDGSSLYWLKNDYNGANHHWFDAEVEIGSGVLADVPDEIKTNIQFAGGAPDFVGDGAGDLATLSVTYASCTPDYCPNPTPPPLVQWKLHAGTAFKGVGMMANSEDDLIGPVFLDFNGDGISDALYQNASTTDSQSWDWAAYQSDGAGLVVDTASDAITWDKPLLSDSVVVDYAGNGHQHKCSGRFIPEAVERAQPILGMSGMSAERSRAM